MPLSSLPPDTFDAILGDLLRDLVAFAVAGTELSGIDIEGEEV
jgi:hypothetical protein